MKITVTFISNSQGVNYQFENGMKIKEILKILQENEIFFMEECSGYVFSKRLQESISTEFTFEQARIYSGDEIKIGK